MGRLSRGCFLIRWWKFWNQDIAEIINKADKAGYDRAKREDTAYLRRELAKKQRECEIAIAEKEAVILSDRRRINKLQAFVDNASQLAMTASYYISHVQSLVAERTIQSNMALEMAAQSNQQHILLEDTIKDLSIRAKTELEKHQKALGK